LVKKFAEIFKFKGNFAYSANGHAFSEYAQFYSACSAKGIVLPSILANMHSTKLFVDLLYSAKAAKAF
jgi:hypothetical protein